MSYKLLMNDEITAIKASGVLTNVDTLDMPTFTFTTHTTDNLERPLIQNVVATADLQCQLNVKEIAVRAKNAEYNPRRFAAVIMRIREPKTTALIFNSGKIVVTGAKDESLARLAARKFTRIIQKIGYSAKFSNFKVQNLVSSCDVRFPIRLEGLNMDHCKFSTYEPEVFPGLIYRMINPKVALLIFVSGKIVLTGAKTREDIDRAFDRIYPVLRQHMKEPDVLSRRS